MQRTKWKQQKFTPDAPRPQEHSRTAGTRAMGTSGSVQVTTEKERQGNTPLSQAGCQWVAVPKIHSTNKTDWMEQNWESEQTHVQGATLALIHRTAVENSVCDCLMGSAAES